jgi:hypothetical protein
VIWRYLVRPITAIIWFGAAVQVFSYLFAYDDELKKFLGENRIFSRHIDDIVLYWPWDVDKRGRSGFFRAQTHARQG